MVSGSVSKVEVSWDQFATGDLPAPSPAHKLFTETVITVAAQAKAALGSLNGRVDKGRDLVLAGLVTRQADYSFLVRSESSKSRSYLVSPDGQCECLSAQKPDKRCKHLLATWIWRRSRQAIAAQAENGIDGAEDAPAVTGMVTPPAQVAVNGTTPTPAPTVSTPPPAPTAAVAEVTPPQPVLVPALSGIPEQFIVVIQGKPFVQFAGLLALAHERGLTSLASQFISVTAELALAEATATFADGRTYTEAADATPANVNAKIRPHFPRMALTRAKARVLRDALNISMVAVEELSD